jgi:hypothetical protein
MITELTPEQEAAIPFYQQKWQNISRSTQPIDREKVISILKDVNGFYREGDLFPEIIFFDSPFAAFNFELEKMIAANFTNTMYDIDILPVMYGEGLIRSDLWFDLDLDLSSVSIMDNYHACQFLNSKLTDRDVEKRSRSIWDFLKEWLMTEIRQKTDVSPDAFICFYNNFIDFDSEWLSYPALFDFCINELEGSYDSRQWNLYKEVITECGSWFLPGGRHWIICDRPINLLFDDENNLHAEGKPAIEYSDGFALYIEHGKIQSIVKPSK